MPSDTGDGVRRRKWGDGTRQVVESIRQGCTTLRQIAERTRIEYRSVNAIVHSLERQGRVAADDYDVRRGLQQFRVVREDRLPMAERGLIEQQREQQRQHRRSNAAAWHCLLQLGAHKPPPGVEIVDDT